jgi:hypothetical protein
VLFADRPSLFIYAFQKSSPAPLLARLSRVVALLGHALEVVSVEKQLRVATVGNDVIDDRPPIIGIIGPKLFALMVRTLAERVSR